MVTVTANKITIEIEDDSPGDLLIEFKNSIIDVLQCLDFKTQHIHELESSQYFVLKILRELINESEIKN